MKKRVFTLVISLICVLSLASCGQDIAQEATEKGKSYFDSGDYETAAKAFGVAIDNGSDDSEVKLLYDMTLGYYQASKAYEAKDYEKAHEIIEKIDEKYTDYGIKDSILTLKNNINKAYESQKLLVEVEEKIAAQDYDGAALAADKIDVLALSAQQTEDLNRFRTVISEAKAEMARQAEEAKKAAEQAAIAAAKKAQQKTNNQTKAKTTATPKTTAPKASAPKAVNVNVSADEYIYPSDTKLLTKEQLKTLNRDEIALIRNEIYARKGHIFNNNKYISYFSAKSWYNPVGAVLWSDLNSIEKANIKLIKEYESTL